MNSNLLTIIISSLLIASCGVKGDPVSPKSSETPSILENYEDIDLPEPLNENKKR